MTPTMPKRIEIWPIERLVPYAKNARTHSDEQIAQIAASILEYGFNDPVEVDPGGRIIAGHGRVLAAKKLGWTQVPVVILEHLDEYRQRGYAIANNKLALNADWNEPLLAEELRELAQEGLDLAVLGFDENELATLLRSLDDETGAEAPEERIPEAPAQAVTRPGDLWLIGSHRLLCGDCRDFRAIARMFDSAKADVVVTSPPYATQREYDPASGFKPIRPDEYIDWYRDVAASLQAVLADDGSYFLNIKEHAEEGQRSLYVKKLFIVHVEQWGWRFVDEFCWRKTDDGVPGGWNNRFKNAWEPIAHFCRQQKIKFRPKAVGHASEDCFDYSPDNPKSASGSGLLGTGARGEAAGRPGASDGDGRRRGIARPSNVIEAKTESSQGSHSAPFPRALPEFFIKAFSDPGDVVFDPFLGSGTTMAAAALLERTGFGIEISPAYCDVVLQRMVNAFPDLTPKLAATGETYEEAATALGVSTERQKDLRFRDSRSIRRKPNGMPCYGSKSKGAKN